VTNPNDTVFTGTEIAIIGMRCRFPDAADPDQFWCNLSGGVESLRAFSDQELTAAGVDPELLKHPQYVKSGYVLDDVEMFDAAFFGLSPKDAEIMDPQHRLFLECAWEALESAGYDPERYDGSIGVYAGAFISTYLLNLYSHPELIASVGELMIRHGNDKDYLATRVSYKLNLQGPSLTVQTSCSTSLVAVHLACQSLLNAECDMALAGGISISFPQGVGYLHHKGDILSPDGHCRAFDAGAQGTIFSPGMGIVVLKRLSDALADGDTIYALIKGSAINNDGAHKVGYTAPSVRGQARVISEALALAQVDPATIGYVEAHGTATPLGDPIEIAALTQAFRARTDAVGYCAIGSVKTNVGHLSIAAGVGGLIKAVLALRHRQMPPSLHFSAPNPAIDFANSPFFVNTTLRAWPAGPTPRRAGVSSFGMGGTNAHVVLEEAPQPRPSTPSRPWQLLVLSAASEAALERMTDRLAEALDGQPDLCLADVAYTLQVGRREQQHRRMLVCRDLPDAVQALAQRDPRRVCNGASTSRRPSVVFLFPGQGAQYVDMARELYQSEAVFREQVDRCAELLLPHLGLDLRSVLYPAPTNDQRPTTNDQRPTTDQGQGDKETRRQGDKGTEQSAIYNLQSAIGESDGQRTTDNGLDQTWITQPALFVVEYALARLWMHWGVEPQALLGHSIGEYVAACLAGVFTLEDALALVAARGRLIQDLPRGAMLSVPLPASALEPLLDTSLDLAAVNAPELCVVAGPDQAIDRLEHYLAERGIAPRRLHTSHAFHSRMIEPIVEAFAARVGQVRLNPPSIPYLSNLTGTWIKEDEATDPAYWAQHLRRTVRFAENVRSLLHQDGWVFLEVGPGRTLSTLVSRQGATVPTPLTSLHRSAGEQSDLAPILMTIGRLWLGGVPIRWQELAAGGARRRVPLPTYPFERRRFWIAPQGPPHRQASPTEPSSPRAPADWSYLSFWKPAALPVADRATVPQRWLVLLDDMPLGAALVRRLEQAGHIVVTAQPAAQFARLRERAYALDPTSGSDYTALLDALRAAGLLPDRIAHLWGLAPEASMPLKHEAFVRAQACGFASMLLLAQALGPLRRSDTLRLWMLTRSAALPGSVAGTVEHAAALGLCLTIPQEYARIACGAIALSPPAAGSPSERWLLDQLVAELSAGPDEPLVAYCGYQRWVRRFEPARLDEPIDGLGLRRGGVYLIAAGPHGIGRELARLLVSSLGAHLLLIEHSVPRWPQWTPADQAVPTVQETQSSDTQMIVVDADLTNPAQVRAAIEQAEERFGRLDGVIHTASLDAAPFGAIAELDASECVRALWSVAAGLESLAQALDNRALDFCSIQSSLSMLLGGPGAAAHAAAQLSAAAVVEQHNRGSAAPWGLIAWDQWQIGAADATPAAEPGISLAEGADLLRRASAQRQLFISTGDLPARLARLQRVADHSPLPQPIATAQHPRPNLPVAYVAPRNDIQRTIASIWQDLLGIEPIGIHDNFFDLGGHSLMATQLASRLRDVLRVDLPLRSVLETMTVADMAVRVAQQQAEHVDGEQLARMLAAIKQSSPDEISAQLAAKRQLLSTVE
jgi:acyl transferase domain-containing protein/acyl carrier protein